MRRFIVLIVTVSLIACESDVTPQRNNGINLTGLWAYSAPKLSEAGGSTCSRTGLALGLTQADTVLIGSTSGSTWDCVGPTGISTTGPRPSYQIRNGRVRGDSVWFDLETEDMHQVGTVHGDSMSGVATQLIRLSNPTRIVTLMGPFTAGRQP